MDLEAVFWLNTTHNACWGRAAVQRNKEYFYTPEGAYKTTSLEDLYCHFCHVWATLNVCPVWRQTMSAASAAVSCSTQLNNPMFPLHLLQFVNNPLLGTAGVKLRHTAASSGHLIRDNHRPVSPGFITQTAGTISQASHSHYTVQYSTGTVQYSTGLALTLHVTHSRQC